MLLLGTILHALWLLQLELILRLELYSRGMTLLYERIFMGFPYDNLELRILV